MPIEIKVPEMGESIVEATVTRWLKKEGDPVAVGDVLLELETEKVSLEVGSENAGVLSSIVRQAGQDVHVGEVIGVIEDRAPAAEKPKSADAAPAKHAAPPAEKTHKIAEPAPEIPTKPEGPGVAARPAAHPAAQPAIRPPEAPPAPTPAQPSTLSTPSTPSIPSTPSTPAEPTENFERVRMSRRRRTIARNLVEAQHTAAMLTTFNEVDMFAVMDLRRRHKEGFKQRHGVGLGIASFFVKAVVGALKTFPEFNAEIQGEDILTKHFYDIGVAMDTADGLVVPVLRAADRMSFAGIEQAIKQYAERAAAGLLTLEDLRGGCFTITNGGVFGSLFSTPILNLPQVGILGLHRIEERPIALGGQVVIHPMMYVALSYDHRVVDGRQAVEFLKFIKETIEDPGALLLEE